MICKHFYSRSLSYVILTSFIQFIPIALDSVPYPIRVDDNSVNPGPPQSDHFVDRILDSLQSHLDSIASPKKKILKHSYLATCHSLN